MNFQYLTLTPTFEITYIGSPSEPSSGQPLTGSVEETMSITREQYCESSAGRIVQPYPGVDSWYASRELVCDDDYEIISTYFGTMLIASMVFMSLLVVPMADSHGRKTMNIFLGLILLISMFLLALSQLHAMRDLKLLTFLICLSCGASISRALVSLIYACELTLPANKAKVIVFCFFCVALKLIIHAASHSAGELSLIVMIWWNILINLLTLPLQALVVPESPHYLYAKD